jgi:hypothetical protein
MTENSNLDKVVLGYAQSVPTVLRRELVSGLIAIKSEYIHLAEMWKFKDGGKLYNVDLQKSIDKDMYQSMFEFLSEFDAENKEEIKKIRGDLEAIESKIDNPMDGPIEVK